MNRRLERIFGRRTNTEPQEVPDSLPTADVPLLNYQQWYERDPALLDKECSLLQNAGVQFECRILSDARLSFVLSVVGKQIGITCPYLYPIEPPQPCMLEDIQIPAIIGTDGKIDLFAHDGFTWSTSTHIVDVVERIKALLSIADSMITKEPETNTRRDVPEVTDGQHQASVGQSPADGASNTVARQHCAGTDKKIKPRRYQTNPQR